MSVRECAVCPAAFVGLDAVDLAWVEVDRTGLEQSEEMDTLLNVGMPLTD